MSEPASVDVSAIIISLNSRQFLADCISSLRGADWGGYTYEVIVADNGSTDGTIEMLGADYPDVRVVTNDRNLGYCKAGNQGAAMARGRYFLFLNDDILILDDALPKLVEFLDRRPDAGMIGSRLLNVDRTDQFSSGRAFTTPANAIFSRKSLLTKVFPNASWVKSYLLSDRINWAEPYEVDWISAAAMMVRRDAFEAAGKLVEDFYYFHEQIICKRMQQAGYKNYLHPQSKIVHYEGMGSGRRTRRIRRAHIKRFHVAAFRWYCWHRQIGLWSPLRWIVAGLLSLRAGVVILWDMLEVERAGPKTVTGRPEGGVPL